ncbi:hypothetical protein B566_EDAN016284 [Ephemera danica]|nr:hypothetical protein B566_EDAN016284 [Ephemera danica]
MDFDLASMLAITQVFPGISCQGCLFYFSQSLWKHAVVTCDLKASYSNDEEIRRRGSPTNQFQTRLRGKIKTCGANSSPAIISTFYTVSSADALREPRIPAELDQSEKRDCARDKLAEVVEEARQNKFAAHERHRKQYDKNRTFHSFAVSDLVLKRTHLLSSADEVVARPPTRPFYVGTLNQLRETENKDFTGRDPQEVMNHLVESVLIDTIIIEELEMVLGRNIQVVQLDSMTHSVKEEVQRNRPVRNIQLPKRHQDFQIGIMAQKRGAKELDQLNGEQVLSS